MTTGEASSDKLTRLETWVTDLRDDVKEDTRWKEKVYDLLLKIKFQNEEFCVSLKETNAKVEAHGIRIAKNENDIASGITNAKTEIKEMIVEVDNKVNTAIAKFEASRKTLLWCLGGWGGTIMLLLGWILKHG